MSAQWSQPSLPEDQWFSVPSQGPNAYVQPSGNGWNGQSMYPDTHDHQSMGGHSYAAHGSVDLGLSPSLSHESQNSHALNSFPDPDFSVLPPSLDLSFSSEPSWTYSGSVVYNCLQAEQHQLPGNAFVPSPDVSSQRMPAGNATSQRSTSQGGYQDPSQSVYYPQVGPASRSAMPQPTVAPGRPLLPRTGGSSAPTSMAQAHAPSQRPIRPLIQSRISSRNPAQSVSTTVSQEAHGHSVGRRLAPGQSVSAKPSGMSASAADQSQARMDSIPWSRPQDMMPKVTDPAAEDFNAFIQYDQDEPASNTPALRSDHNKQLRRVGHTNTRSSYASGFAPMSSVPSTLSLPEDFHPASSKETEVKPAHAAKPAKASHTGDADEGRHRNHPLYSQGAMPDGLFHCPYKAQENCPHKPTKLKCNYEYD